MKKLECKSLKWLLLMQLALIAGHSATLPMPVHSRHRPCEPLPLQFPWWSHRTVIPFLIGTNGAGAGDAVKSHCPESGADLLVDFEIGADYADKYSP